MTTTEEFQSLLESHTDMEVVQRALTSGSCSHLDEARYADLKAHVSTKYSVSHHEVLVVGSAKLGFSIAPGKRYRTFGEESDIDVAIISTSLYVAIWRQVNAAIAADPTFNWPNKSGFRKYHVRGWIRPDFLPPSPALPLADEWFDYFQDLTAQQVCGPYKISAGIYYDLRFLEEYQASAVNQCREEIDS